MTKKFIQTFAIVVIFILGSYQHSTASSEAPGFYSEYGSAGLRARVVALPAEEREIRLRHFYNIVGTELNDQNIKALTDLRKRLESLQEEKTKLFADGPIAMTDIGRGYSPRATAWTSLKKSLEGTERALKELSEIHTECRRPYTKENVNAFLYETLDKRSVKRPRPDVVKSMMDSKPHGIYNKGLNQIMTETLRMSLATLKAAGGLSF